MLEILPGDTAGGEARELERRGRQISLGRRNRAFKGQFSFF